METGQVVRWIRSGMSRRSSIDFAPSDFQPGLKTHLFVLQSTPFCNLDCDYCYLPARDSKARMSFETLRIAAERLVDDGLVDQAISVIWHAGEPTTLPATWYEDAIGLLERAFQGQATIRHSIQTNATCIDDHWCALIRRHGIHVGISLDGPALLHDERRRTRAGKGSHARAMAGVRRLQHAGIRFHVIAVVGPRTFEEFDAFVGFFDALGITELGCNFDEVEGLNGASRLAGNEKEHRAFLQKLLARYGRPGAAFAVRELEAARQLINRRLPEQRWRGSAWPLNWQVLPFAILSIAHDGAFTTFSPELLGQASRSYGDFRFGNVHRSGYLQAAMACPEFRTAWSDVVAGIRACERGCAYFSFCGGGAPANKFYELGDLAGTETLYCRTMLQRPLNVVLESAEAALPAVR